MATLNTIVVTTSISRLAGGLFTSVRRLHQTLNQFHRVNVHVFGPHDKFTDADLALWKPLPIETFPVSVPRQWGYSPGLSRAMFASEWDLAHTHGLWMHTSVVTSDWHRQTGRPYLISPHGMLDPWALNNSRWKKMIAYCLFEREHLRRARCLRALCASEARSIRRLQLKNDIAVIPNGIDLPEIESAETMKVGKRKTEGENPPWKDFVEPGKKVLLFLSRIHPKKGLVNLLKAWAQIEKSEIGSRKSEWVLAIAGWDQAGHEQELKQLATNLGLTWTDVRGKSEIRNPKSEIAPLSSKPTSLIFLGPQFNGAKSACYHLCDAFVLPSFSEGLPMVVLEAWANSKPVIMTPECNLPEGFPAGAALKVEANEASLVAGLNELRRMTTAERVQMGNRARDLVVERFTWPRVANQLQEVHEWILGGGTKPNCVLEA
jgi:glycosyltransferase involved in cell wall biosynthesis